MTTHDRPFRTTGFEVHRRSRRHVRKVAHYLIDHVRNEIGYPGDIFPVVKLIEFWGSECGPTPGKHYPNFEICESDDLPEGVAEFSAHDNTIRVERAVWDDANAGDPESCSVLAHELGHVMLSHYAAAGRYAAKLRIVDPETDSEYQANWFADELLMDSRLIGRSDGVAALVSRFNCSESMATRRIRDAVYERTHSR